MLTELPFCTAAEQEAAATPAVVHLRAGGLLAHPTETVYGLGCTLDIDPLERLARIKGGRSEKAFLLLVADPAHAPGLCWTEAAHRLTAAFWPGPLTVALKAEGSVYPAHVLGPGRTVALRRPGHAGLQRLLHQLAAPITSTSANRPGEKPLLTAGEVRNWLTGPEANASFLLLDAGTLTPSAPSTLVDCSEPVPRLARPGAISFDDLKRVVHELRT
jgi:L-threonylcarbamoyladenylate synthase